MTVRALLEPLTGCGWSAPLSLEPVDTPYHPHDPECPWSVRVTDWNQTWDPLLPPGMRIDAKAKLRHAVGRLTQIGLTTWIHHLTKAGMHFVADTLSATLSAHLRPRPIWNWGSHKQWRLDFSRPLIMGIINVTTDSFSGDGLGEDQATAIDQGIAMAQAGADLLDIGGESTRPGAQPVTGEIERNRVEPVVRELAQRLTLPICVDTSKPEVMTAALDAGAALINDVTALRAADSQQTVQMLAKRDTPLILMHMQNEPTTMQQAPCYQDVVAEVYDFLAQRIDFCLQHGMNHNRLICDPGIGFGKTTQHNLALLRKSRVFNGLGVPVLLGLSRKRIVGALTGQTDPSRRDAATHLLGALIHGEILRVHDVAGAQQAMKIVTGLTLTDLEAMT